MPSVLIRLLASYTPRFRRSSLSGNDVSSCTTASGRAATTASASARASKTSQTTASAPAARIASERSALRVIPVTS